jgi:hypothetical protein
LTMPDKAQPFSGWPLNNAIFGDRTMNYPYSTAGNAIYRSNHLWQSHRPLGQGDASS